MEINHNLAEVLNDLIRINNDRIEGYQKAIEDAGDSDIDLKVIFSRMIDESRQYISQLSHEVFKLGQEPASGSTTVSGKIYRAWMDIKSKLAGTDRLSLLELCENGEYAAQKAYQQALISDETLSIDIRQLIARQKELLKESHDTIRRFRDMHKKSNSDNIVNSNQVRNSEMDLRSKENLSNPDDAVSSESFSNYHENKFK
jgi:uncharacterized protein (TIGR02284 family)